MVLRLYVEGLSFFYLLPGLKAFLLCPHSWSLFSPWFDSLSTLHKTRLLIDLNHCEYIFLRTSSAQDLNSISLFTKHGHGKRGVLENELYDIL